MNAHTAPPLRASLHCIVNNKIATASSMRFNSSRNNSNCEIDSTELHVTKNQVWRTSITVHGVRILYIELVLSSRFFITIISSMRMIYDTSEKRSNDTRNQKQSKNYQCLLCWLVFLFFQIYVAVIFVCSKVTECIFTNCVPDFGLSFYVSDFSATATTTKTARRRRAKKNVLFDNILLNIIVLKLKQNVSNCGISSKQNKAKQKKAKRTKQQANVRKRQQSEITTKSMQKL